MTAQTVEAVSGLVAVNSLIAVVGGVLVAFVGGGIVYGAVKILMGWRLSAEDAYLGADLAIHKITAQPDYNRGEV